MTPAAPDEVLFLLYHSALKPVQERLRNYFQKYLPAVQEITPEEWATVEGKARNAEIRQGARRVHFAQAGPAHQKAGAASAPRPKWKRSQSAAGDNSSAAC